VLTDLNPWVVAGHFLLSMAVLAAAYALWSGTRPGPGPAAAAPGLAWAVTAVAAAVLAAGTVVTGSGPHAGDAQAPRTGLDPGQVAQVHADLVFLLLGLSVGLWFATRTRAAAVLVAVELGQGLVGFTQYFTHLPELLVGVHMAGACLVWLAALAALDRALPRRPSRPGGHGYATPSRDAIAAANRRAAPSAYPRNSDGSVSSTSTTSGSPPGPGIRSTRA
jgi:cytochrome c oxidase assembly protein subunit 15